MDKSANAFSFEGFRWVQSDSQEEDTRSQREALADACDLLRLKVPEQWLDGLPNEYLKKRAGQGRPLTVHHAPLTPLPPPPGTLSPSGIREIE